MPLLRVTHRCLLLQLGGEIQLGGVGVDKEEPSRALEADEKHPLMGSFYVNGRIAVGTERAWGMLFSLTSFELPAEEGRFRPLSSRPL